MAASSNVGSTQRCSPHTQLLEGGPADLGGCREPQPRRASASLSIQWGGRENLPTQAFPSPVLYGLAEGVSRHAC